MFRQRPLIGVSGPDRGGHAAWLFTRTCLFLCGARAVRITPSRKPVPQLDGLVLGGGADIDPSRYDVFGEQTRNLQRDLRDSRSSILAWILYPLILLSRMLLSSKRTGRIDNTRDDMEFELLAYAVSNNLPVLGICRGAQLLNIHFGGTLYQDITEFYNELPNVRSVFPKKLITVMQSTNLAKALGNAGEYHVNALHEQAIRETGEGLQVTARELTGVIQAIEHNDYPFIIGVQWHPEYLIGEKSQRCLFRALVRAANVQRQKAGKSL